MSRKIGFKFKLISSYVIVVLASFLFLAFFLSHKLEENSIHNIETSLVNQARIIEGLVRPEDIKKEDISRLEGIVAPLGNKLKCRITIITRNGKVLADFGKSENEIAGMENHIGRTEVSAALAGDVGIETRFSSTLKMDMLYVALPLEEKGRVIGVLRLALPLQTVNETLKEARRTILLGLVFALALAFVLGSILATQTTQPLKKMIRVSRSFAQGDFGRRVMIDSKDEIGELAATLNRMAEDIENKVEEIESQNQKLAAIFDSMIEGIIVVDKDTRVVSINPTAEEIFDISAKDIKGKLFLEAIRNNDVFDIINGALNNREPCRGEMAIIYPVRKIFEVSATPVFAASSVAGSVAVIHDITEIRRLERVRSDFIANVSHELKTPLTSIKGYIETLLEGAIDDKANSREFLGIIQEHAERLTNLVNDLLSLSHLESKEIALNRESVNLREAAAEVILGFSSQIRKKSIEIKNELSAHLSVAADRNRLIQVFTNLIDNAIKFNKEKGLIKIYRENINDRIKIIVEDSGLGIPEKDIPRIFERFYRVDKARSRDLGGTGLGLSIVKHIVELHGGSAGVESVEGLGSKFYFMLPK